MTNSFKQSLQNLQNSVENTPMLMMLSPDTEPEITVDMDKRTVTVPEELYNIGVVSDNNAETVYFRIPSTTFDGIDLTDKVARVEYINAGKEYNSYQIKEIEIENGTMKLGWTIDNKVTRYVGIVRFQLSFELDTDYRWSTIPANLNILAGLDINSAIPASESTIVSALFDRMNELETIVGDSTVIITANTIKDDMLNIQNQVNAIEEKHNSLQTDVNNLKEHVVYVLEDVE